MNKMHRCAQLLAVEGERRYQRIFRIMDLPASTPRPEGWLTVGRDVFPDTHYWDGAGPVPFPPSPGPGWVFSYSSLSWVADEEYLWAQVRRERDDLLRACDWRVLPDAPTPPAERELWLAYRQALRDITGQPDPSATVWPQVPL